LKSHQLKNNFYQKNNLHLRPAKFFRFRPKAIRTHTDTPNVKVRFVMSLRGMPEISGNPERWKLWKFNQDQRRSLAPNRSQLRPRDKQLRLLQQV
jgi:hypothetical protein